MLTSSTLLAIHSGFWQTFGVIAVLLAALCIGSSDNQVYFSAPAGSRTSHVNPGGLTILPNGRYLTPLGSRIYCGENCWNIVLAPNHKTGALFYDGGLSLYGDLDDPAKTVTKLKREGAAYCGQFSPDGQTLVTSSGERGGIQLILVAHPETATDISGNVNGAKGTYITDLALSPNGQY
jgi:hypothetical protein